MPSRKKLPRSFVSWDNRCSSTSHERAWHREHPWLKGVAWELFCRQRVAGANLANGDHMAEEEREGLTDFRRLAGLQQRHDLAVAFAAFAARNFAGVQPCLLYTSPSPR